MIEFSDVWDGRLGTVRIVKDRLNLDPQDAKPIRSAPYLPGPRAFELKKEEIDKLELMNLI